MLRAQATLFVRCLGTFAYRGKGTWQSGPAFKRGREFLQYLSTYPRAAASSEKLLEAFWPDLETEAVRHRLHLAVTGARAALRNVFPEIDAIRCVGAGYVWNPAVRVESDFEELLACYRNGTDAAMKRGISLYVGEYCSGEVADWMYPLRARASYAYVTMLERLADASAAQADYSNALAYALQLVEADRGHEGATRLAMRAFAALGRRSAALEKYDVLRLWLHRRLCVAPSRATDALRDEIARGG